LTVVPKPRIHSVVMDATNVLLENNKALWDGGYFQYGNDGFDFGGPLRNVREFYDTCSTTDDCSDIFSAGNLYLEGMGRQVAGTVDGVLVEHNTGAAQEQRRLNYMKVVMTRIALQPGR